MRALQMTNNRGAPQGWAQDCMYLATWAIFIQFIMVVLAGACLGSKAETDEDGNVVKKFDNKCGAYTVTAIRYLGLLLLYGGVITVITSIFLITPETKDGQGAMPLMTDGTVPVVGETLSEPAPGVNDAAKAWEDVIGF